MSVQKKSLVFVAVCALTMACTAAAASAGVITSLQNNANHIAFNSNGTLGGVVFGNPGTYDGIEFSTWNSPFTTAKTIGASTVSVVANSGLNGVFEFGGGQQYQFGAYTSGGGTITLTFAGLDSAKTYEFQFGFYDARGATYSADASFKLSDDSTATQALQFGNSPDFDPTNEKHALLSATVSGSTSLVLSLPRDIAGNVGPSIDGFAVRTVDAVPEPSTLVIMAAGLVGLLAYAWRKRK